MRQYDRPSELSRKKRALTAFTRQPVDFCDMLASRLRNLRQHPVKPYLCDPGWETEDAARAGFRTTPELIPGTRRTPGFDIILGISTRHQRFAFARLSGSYLTGSSPAFCCNAHYHRF